MSDEFGEDPSYYIWPKEKEDGESFGDDFHERLSRALATENLGWESV
jgi:hypothetical protein